VSGEPDPGELSDEARVALAHMAAAAEQAASSTAELASIVGAYFRNLLRAGFKREEALDLCIAYQGFLLMTPGPTEGEPDAS
jgi:hypothetical protein